MLVAVPQSFADDLIIRRIFSVAGYTILIWDFILTLSREIHYIWTPKLSTVNLVFLANRYANLICQTVIIMQELAIIRAPSHQFCSSFKSFMAIFIIVSIESIHILVLLRAWVFWGYERKKATILITIYGVYLLSIVGITVWCMSVPQALIVHYRAAVGTCVYTVAPYSWSFWVISIILDLSVFLVTMRSLRFYSDSHRERYPTLLLRLLYRDAVIFFTLGITNSALVILAWTVYADGPKNNIPVTFTVPLLNIAGQRLVLNLRSTMAHSQRHAMDTTRLDQEVSRQIRAFVGVESDPMLSGHECNRVLGCGAGCVCDVRDVALPTSSSCCEHELQERVERHQLGDVRLTEVADSEEVDSYHARNS